MVRTHSLVTVQDPDSNIDSRQAYPTAIAEQVSNQLVAVLPSTYRIFVEEIDNDKINYYA